jgi:hypothetical protein
VVQRELALLLERDAHRLGERPTHGVVGGTGRGVPEFIGDLLIGVAADPQFRGLGVAPLGLRVTHVGHSPLQF